MGSVLEPTEQSFEVMPSVPCGDHDRDQRALALSWLLSESEDGGRRSLWVETAPLQSHAGFEASSGRRQRLGHLRRPERKPHRLPRLEAAQRVGCLVEASAEIVHRGEPQPQPLDAAPHVPQPGAQACGAVGGIGVSPGHRQRHLVGLPDHRGEFLEDDLERSGGTGMPRTLGAVGGHARDGRRGDFPDGSSHD